MHLLYILLIVNFANFEQKRLNDGQSVKIQTFRTPIDTGIPMLDSFANILPEKYCQRPFKRSTMTQNQNGQLQSRHQSWIFHVFVVVANTGYGHVYFKFNSEISNQS